MKLEAGHRGPDVRNDCWIKIDPAGSGIQIESSVGRLYGNAIRRTIEATLAELQLEDVGVQVVDSGAFDFCLRARLEAAAYPLSGKLLELAPRQVSRRFGRDRLRRTRLYLPGNTPKFFVNARLYESDALVLDLEDAVPAAEKLEARSLVRHALAAVDFGNSERMVRPNLGDEGRADLQALAGVGVDTMLVPKVESPAELARFRGEWDLLPLLETARGLAASPDIAAAPDVCALAIGVEDYLTDIGADRKQPDSLTWAYGQLVNAARAEGLSPFGSVYGQVDDLEGFAASTRALRGRGLEGVGCLHPSQVGVALEAFRPSDEEVYRAQAILVAYGTTQGVVSVDGQMVDVPVARRAQRIVDRSRAGRQTWRDR